MKLKIGKKTKNRKTIKTKVDKKINKIKIDKILGRLSIKEKQRENTTYQYQQ